MLKLEAAQLSRGCQTWRYVGKQPWDQVQLILSKKLKTHYNRIKTEISLKLRDA